MIGHVIHCSGQGIKTLWTDEIDLASLGELQISRASEIEYNNDRQTWEVRIPMRDHPESYEVRYRDPSRAACLSWERDHFNAQLMQS